MTEFRIETRIHEGETLYDLRHERTGAFARVWPAFGNNCIEARLPVVSVGKAKATPKPVSVPPATDVSPRLVDLLLPPASLDELRRHPSGSGIPLLFPTPSRIPGGEYAFHGKHYVFGCRNEAGDTMHGFAQALPWRVEETKADDTSARLVCSLSSDDHPQTLEGYPFPYRVETAYRLDADGLTLETTVRPLGDVPLPFGFGAHPYFRVPFAPDSSDRGRCRIVIPAASRWDMNVIADVRDRSRLARPACLRPVGEGVDYRTPLALGEHHLDDVLTDLEPCAGDGGGDGGGEARREIECRVLDPATGLEGVMRATDNFPTLVVYTPPDRPGLCFEPWTCPPNALNLEALGVENSGLVTLHPGQTWRGTMRLFLRETKRETQTR